MKDNAHLYWPPASLTDCLASWSVTETKRPTDQPRMRLEGVEQLNGGCVLYRLGLLECGHGVPRRGRECRI